MNTVIKALKLITKKIIIRANTFDGNNPLCLLVLGKVFTLKKQKVKHSTNEPVFYLKINNFTDNFYICLNKWLDLIHYRDGVYYIICDKNNMKKNVLQKCRLPYINNGVFITSNRRKIKKYTNKYMPDSKWNNATFAHLTPFVHSEKNKITTHWDIDADDTMFFLNNKDLSYGFNLAEKIAKCNKIGLFSYDMWHTLTKGESWSLGVVLANNDVLEPKRIFFNKSSPNVNWYKDIENNKSIDHYITYLAKKKLCNAETFYFNHVTFLHCGGPMFQKYIYHGIFKWADGYLLNCLVSDDFFIMKIPEDTFKINLGKKRDFFQKEFIHYIVGGTKYVYR